MVYHGIGLKNSYYNDIDARIDMRAVESKPRLEELKTQGHKNLILTGLIPEDFNTSGFSPTTRIHNPNLWYFKK